jgi:serine/threonine protein kinase
MAMTASGSTADRDPIEVMAESFLDRFRRGERPSIDDYAARHPELAGEIRELLPALVQLELGLSAGGEATGSHQAPVRAESLRDAPRQLGDYTLLREVGRGGMGVVYEAVQQSLGRHVALKVLPWQAVGESTQLERFRLEARSAARLHHTNIVPVFGVGEADGVHYYAMQFIHGQGLDAVIDELRRIRDGEPREESKPPASATLAATVARSLLGEPPTPEGTAAGSPPAGAGPEAVDPPSVLSTHSELTGGSDRRYYRQVARLALQVAEALAYAHGQGVLHRDIKPSNLLVDTRGTVWITDFGLAKAEGSDGPTRTGDVVGTLRYMAPERFEGRSDRRSDVYALGATLFELLTLRPLFGEGSRAKLVEQVLHEPAPSPRRSDRRVPRDLETICLKALAKEPEHRYRDAEAMAADLRRFIDDRPILTRRASTTEQVWRWARRNPAVAGLLALVLLMMIGGTTAAGLAAYHFRNLAVAEADARARADRLAGAEKQAHALAESRAKEAQAARDAADAKAREAQAVADFFVLDLIGAAAPGKGQGLETTVGEALRRAEATVDKRFADQPLVAAAVHMRLGDTYWNLTKHDKAGPHYRKAARLREEHLGPMTRETLESQARVFKWMHNPAAGSSGQNRRDYGLALLERARRALGPEDPLTLGTMLSLGDDLVPYNDDRAPEHYRKLTESLERIYGPEAEETLYALLEYGGLFIVRGNHERASEIFRRVLEARIRLVGEVDAATFYATGLLSDALINARKYDEAWSVTARAWDVMVRAVDPDNHDLCWQTFNALAIATATSRWGRAEVLFRAAAEELRVKLGPEHARTRLARASTACALAEQGRADEALAVVVELLETVTPAHAADLRHSDVLGWACVALERARRDVPGGDSGARASRSIARRLAEADEALAGAGKPPEAVAAFLKAVQSGRSRVCRLFMDHASWIRAGNPDLPLAAFRTAIKLAPDGPPPGVPPVLMNNMAWALVSVPMDRPDPEILAWAVRLAQATTAAAKGTQEEGSYANTLGVAHYRAGAWPAAIAALERSVARLGDEMYSSNGFFLAMARWRLGEQAEALRLYDRSVAWMEQHASKDPELIRFRAEAEALIRLDPTFPADPFAPGR